MKYITELSQAEYEHIKTSNETWGWLRENYKQPPWCDYPESIDPMGCWSLISWPWDITEQYCHNCDCFGLYKPEGRLPLSHLGKDCLADTLIELHDKERDK